jgi:hypothetical protein
MGLPTAEAEAAFITRYMGDSTLQGLLGNPANPPGAIYDAMSVPTGAPFPYVVVQPITSQLGTAFAFGTDATDLFMQVSVYTQSGGFAQARAIAKQVYSLTHRYQFSLSGGFTNILTLFENEQEVPQPDGLTQAIIHRYKLDTQG